MVGTLGRVKALRWRMRRILVPPPAAGWLARAASVAGGSARTLILNYHRVNDLQALGDPDPNGLIVDVRHFDGHMRVLRRWYDVVPLTEIGRPARRGRRRVAVTFDDGYEDNYTHALPILRRHGVPATVFVTTDTLGSSSGFWWDRLQRALWALPTGTVELAPPCGGLLVVEPVERRKHSYRLAYAAVSNLPAPARDRVIAGLEAEAGDPAALPPLPPTMSVAQLRDLRACGVEIGSHTRSHPRLSTLAADAARAEIAGSKQALERVVGGGVDSFAYPFGSLEDFTAETVALVRASGYRRACSTIERLTGAEVDPFTLGRITVFDWDEKDFAYILLRHWAMWGGAAERESPPHRRAS